MNYACYHTSDTLVRMCPFQVLNLLKTLWRIGRTYQRAANIEHTIILYIVYSSSYGHETDMRPMQTETFAMEALSSDV